MRIIVVTGMMCTAFVLFQVLRYYIPLLHMTFSAWQVWRYQQVPAYCIRQPGWRDDLSASMGGYLGIGLWLLLTIISVRVAVIVRDMLEEKACQRYPLSKAL